MTPSAGRSNTSVGPAELLPAIRNAATHRLSAAGALRDNAAALASAIEDRDPVLAGAVAALGSTIHTAAAAVHDALVALDDQTSRAARPDLPPVEDKP